MHRFVLLTFGIALLFLAFRHNQQTPICRDLRKGSFYAHGRNGEQIRINRSDSIQQDIYMRTRDTMYWKLKWTGECRFTAIYLGGNDTRAEVVAQRENASFIYEVQQITPDYYIGKTTVRSLGSRDSEYTDTTWLRERVK